MLIRKSINFFFPSNTLSEVIEFLIWGSSVTPGILSTRRDTISLKVEPRATSPNVNLPLVRLIIVKWKMISISPLSKSALVFGIMVIAAGSRCTHRVSASHKSVATPSGESTRGTLRQGYKNPYTLHLFISTLHLHPFHLPIQTRTLLLPRVEQWE